jgi:hypothetical protein
VITIVSGLPGNGKTLYAVQLLQKRKAAGKLGLYKNINGLSPAVATEWQHDLSEWRSLPPGALLVVDESQDFAATRGKQGSPEWVTALSKHRHQGIDIVFLTQDPRFLDPWVRRLCNQHIHLERKLGFEASTVFEWSRCEDDVTDFHARERAIKSVFRFPRELYSLYKSAEIHTIKRRIPLKVYLFFALIPICGFLFWFGLHRFFNGDVAKHPVISADGRIEGDTTGTYSGAPKKILTGDEYVQQFTPVVGALPWSAPAFQSMKPSDFPVLYCMVIDKGIEKDCKCLTQQGTRYKLDKSICIRVAVDGVFDPFNSSRRDLRRAGDRDSHGNDDWAGRMQAQAQPAASAPDGYSFLGGSASQVPVGSGAFRAGPTSNASGPILPPANPAPVVVSTGAHAASQSP